MHKGLRSQVREISEYDLYLITNTSKVAFVITNLLFSTTLSQRALGVMYAWYTHKFGDSRLGIQPTAVKGNFRLVVLVLVILSYPYKTVYYIYTLIIYCMSLIPLFN